MTILLAGGDALVYLAGPMLKKYSTTFVWGQPFNTYISYNQFFNPPPPYMHMYAFRVTHLLRTSFRRFDTLLSRFNFARLP